MTANVISITEQNTASVSGTVESADQSHSTLTAAQLLTAAASQGVSITPQYTQVVSQVKNSHYRRAGILFTYISFYL